MTVGVPVTIQPGNVTELYPDSDGSPYSASAFTSKFGLRIAPAMAAEPGESTVRELSCCGPGAAARLNAVGSNSRRANPISTHSSGVSTGASGLPVIDGAKPTNPSTVETTSVMMLGGAGGAVFGAGLGCGVGNPVDIDANVIDDGTAVGPGAIRRIGALLAGSSCDIRDVTSGNEAFRSVVSGASFPSAPDGDPAGGSVSACAGALFSGWPVGLVKALSLSAGSRSVLDAIALVCAPPVLCTTPVRGSVVAEKPTDDERSAFDDVDEAASNDDEPESDVVLDADD